MVRSWHSSSRLAFLPRWLVFLSAGLAACGGGSGTDSATGALASRQLAAATVDNLYQMRNLSLEGSSKGFVTPKGINASGQVAGHIVLADGTKRAFMFDGSTMRDLGTLGGETSEAVAINDAGQVAGNAQVQDGSTQAFRYDPDGVNGQMHALSTTDIIQSKAIAINAWGHVLGDFVNNRSKLLSYIHNGSTLQTLTNGEGLPLGNRAVKSFNDDGLVIGDVRGVENAFFFDGSTATQLNASKYAPANSTSITLAIAINNAGQFVTTINFYFRPAQVAYRRAAIWNDVNTSQLIGLPDESSSIALDINDASQVLGQSWNAAGNSRGFIANIPDDFSDITETADIGNLGGNDTIPVSFNQSGQAIGQSKNANGDWRAFAWTASQGMVDLNTRLRNAPDGLVLENALAIADNGSIVALTDTGDLVLLTTAPNAAPALGPIMGSVPVTLNTPLAFSASFTDADAVGTHTALWNWGDGSTSNGTISGTPESGSVSGSHAYSAAGIYTASLTITDDEGLSAQVSRTVVVYDPAAGFVTGGGWFNSPAGAWTANPNLAGKANFAISIRYQKNSNVPSGNTQIQFHTGGMNFRSDSVDWLVIESGRARYAGHGTLNGQAGYRYQLTAIDGAGSVKGRLRMRIWSVDRNGQEVAAYDNQLDPAGAGTPEEGSALGGGQVSIHD